MNAEFHKPNPKSGYLIGPGHSFRSITETITGIVFGRTPRAWWVGAAVGFGLLMLLLYSVAVLFAKGTGIWGINIPVGWGFAIDNLVWWIGIGHAGTLISAILLLFRQEWRTSINRFAEAMTLFAVACASLFPILHLGRPWLAYWLFPYPNTFGLWPQFRSPLVWDAFAIGSYATVSLLFWFVGLIPDLAAMRDRAGNRLLRTVYGILALGWRGAADHWQRYDTAYLLLAALATPLVVSVHSVVSMDFAIGVLPGWHSTVFPPYFVAGAIFSGFAMVVTLLVPLRKIYRLEDFITLRHLDNMAKVMLATGLFVAYGYVTEAFTAWYSGNPAEHFWLFNRSFGPFAWAFWALMLCNILVPQALWSARVRTSPLLLFVVAIVVNIGMWMERFVIIVGSLQQDFLPSSWGSYAPTGWDWGLFLGTIGLFVTLIFLFVRVLPMISIFEMRHLLAETEKGGDAAPTHGTETPSVVAAPLQPEGGSGALYGLMAEFADGEELVARAQQARAAGYRKLAAYSPFPIAELPAALGLRKSRLPWLVLLSGIAGGVAGFGMQYYAAVISYPLNIGGRPLNSWPAFIIVTFELTILAAAGAAVLGMLLRNGLPQPYHAVFNAPGFERASQDRFFLCVEATDPAFDRDKTHAFLQSLHPARIVAVEP